MDDLVLVEWVDAAHHREPEVAASLTPIVLCTTGRLLHNDDERLVIACEWDKEQPHSCRDVTAIPKVCVVGITFIREESR